MHHKHNRARIFRASGYIYANIYIYITQRKIIFRLLLEIYFVRYRSEYTPVEIKDKINILEFGYSLGRRRKKKSEGEKLLIESLVIRNLGLCHDI